MSKLITYAYLKVETDISQNIEVAQLDNPIKWAHDQLKFILGKRFYDELISQGTTNPTTFTTANAAFFDPYVKQFLAWVAYHDYLVKSQSYTTRTGIRVFKEENSDPASDSNVNMLVKLASDKVQFYKGNMMNYITDAKRASSTAFPLYTNSTNQNFGSGFGISGVSRISTEVKEITQKKIQNGY